MSHESVTNLLERLAVMDSTHRLVAVRKQRGLTQQALADTVGVHVTQLRRHEVRTNQATLDVLRASAAALAVSADDLVFDPDERAGIRALIEGALLRHQARRLAQTS